MRKEAERETNVIEEQSRQRIGLLKVNRHVIEEHMNIEQVFLAGVTDRIKLYGTGRIRTNVATRLQCPRVLAATTRLCLVLAKPDQSAT
jgi:hypothetical protein